MKSIYDLEIIDLEEYFLSINEKKYKAKQVYEWLYKKRVTSFKEMTNLKKSLIDQLEKDFSFESLTILKTEKGKLVNKYLFLLPDQEKIEAVLMFHDYGNSLCISTEVGCNMGCAFCESGRLIKVRSLKTFEMVLQVLLVEASIKERISHVVLMGIGEPFDNYDSVLRFIRIINSNQGIDIGARHITVSTCGIVPKIEQLSKENIQINLAISLHAPTNELRNKLMPINKVYPIEKLFKALKKYYDLTNRRITFEYIMLDNVNDSLEDAQALADLLRGINCYVNLIPYNETSHLQFKKSSHLKIMAFYDILKKNKINVTIRKEFGSEVSAACGQLRSTN